MRHPAIGEPINNILYIIGEPVLKGDITIDINILFDIYGRGRMHRTNIVLSRNRVYIYIGTS